MPVTISSNEPLPVTFPGKRVPPITLSIEGMAVLHAFEANTFVSRLRGLHAYLPIEADQALIIRPCSAIHTFGMPISIDAVFLNATGYVLRVETLDARRWLSVPGAAAVLETNAGNCCRLGVERGVRLVRDTGVWA